jgi:putative ABC transport system substrate-binding protein
MFCTTIAQTKRLRREMIGRTVALILALSVLATPLPADAQQAGKVWRIGVLLSGAVPREGAPPASTLTGALRELGYVENENLAWERRYAEGRLDRLSSQASELVQLKVDVIFTSSTAGAKAAQNATGVIPIVFIAVADPVGSGLVSSLSRPGGNITGVSTQLIDLEGKLLQLLKECIPGASRVAVLWNPKNVASAQGLQDAERLAALLGMKLIPIGTSSPADVEPALATMSRDRPDAVVVHPIVPMWDLRLRIMKFTVSNRLPTISAAREMADAGALFTYGPSLSDQLRLAAVYIDKLFKGAKPGDLPVQQPTKFELIINGRTAKALGLTIPPSLLLRADQVIE